MERTKLGQLGWADLQAVDIEAQSSFYEALFGWTHEDLPTGEDTPPYRMFYLDGAIVAGGNRMSPAMLESGMPSYWTVYLATPELDATLAKAEAAGAQVIMPAMDVLSSGRMVGIADPTGGGVFLWQARDHKGAEVFMEPGSIAWADLATRDPQAAADFYAEVFGYEIQYGESPVPYWQLKVDGEGQGGVMGMPDTMGEDARPVWTLYFGVTGIGAGVARAQELGATLYTPPTDIGGEVAFAILADPAGAVFALLGPSAG